MERKTQSFFAKQDNTERSRHDETLRRSPSQNSDQQENSPEELLRNTLEQATTTSHRMMGILPGEAGLFGNSRFNVPRQRQLATIRNPEQATLIKSLNLCHEMDRLQTFTSQWPGNAAPSATEMAASGWFFLGNLDRTQCFSCGGVLRNWRRLDNPNTEHITHFPHCLMSKGQERRNIPDSSRKETALNFTHQVKVLTTQQASDLCLVFPCLFPKTPTLRSVEDRVNTFRNWYFTRAPPQVLAEAGFYSLGVRDRVKCFYCNGGLQNWRQNDNPWEEHAKWYPDCEFLLQKRGPEYTNAIAARFPNMDRLLLQAKTQNTKCRTSCFQKGPDPCFTNAQGSEENILGITNESRVIETAMLSEVVKTVLGMGFDESLVRHAINKKFKMHGAGFDTAASLLDAVMEVQRVQEVNENNSDQTSLDNSQPGTGLADGRAVDDIEDNISKRQKKQHQTKVSPRKHPCSVNPAGRSDAAAAELRKTLQELHEQRLCKVCLDRRADAVSVPCGHISFCMECTKALRVCPMCRRKIDKAMRIYTS